MILYGHTSASLLLCNGTNIKTVSNRLGHTNLSTTNRYLHSLAEADTIAAKTLEHKLNFNKIGQKWDRNA
ncbi:MAG: tyrosine-type recombinase/integrase [Firmicutes bacterium]|nr:tyrosine-type recombinase/integrase [Bacillota bacterium]